MIYSTYFQVRERTTGKCPRLAEVNSFLPGAQAAEVARLHEVCRGNTPEGIQMRADYSDVVFVVDNGVRHHYSFPDPAVAEREAKQSALASARRLVAEHEESVRTHVGAANRLRVAQIARDNAAQALTKLEEEFGEAAPEDTRAKERAALADRAALVAKAETDRLAAEKTAAEKAKADRLATEKAANDRASADIAIAQQVAADKAAAKKAEADKAAADRAAAEQDAREKAAAAEATAGQAAADQVNAQ